VNLSCIEIIEVEKWNVANSSNFACYLTPAVWPTQPPDQWVPGFFVGLKESETEADYSIFIQRRG
jgi:hypothetical protein